ncbi:glycoprotease [Vararia minispora EC-137]|uniref:Glycoprotease n=1 Tax=Vararia minispora EC-137 TaxID=1314806 RepID=A0ACB8QY72_9AGAM|nr:glycoprotease [Vararia minispora EC-137]
MFSLSSRPSLARTLSVCCRPYLARQFTVLAIETSADDTGVALVTHDRHIRANVVIKQHAVHEQHGGIHPMYAARLHMRNVPGAVWRALTEAGMAATDVDGIAFTRGPGMPGALGVGATAAKTLAAALNKPLVGVHHMQAHALTAFLTCSPSEAPTYPFLTLLVSGGHTLLLLAYSPKNFRVLATTLDSAVGRVYDKVARMLGIPWGPLGPGAALEAFCAPMPPPDITFTSGSKMRRRMAFSYAGLQSAVQRYIEEPDREAMDDEQRKAIAQAFQRTAVAQLEDKVTLGIRMCQQMDVSVRHVVVSGGVASNEYLRERLRETVARASPDMPIQLVFPPPALCTDNGVMIAWAAMGRFLVGDYDKHIIDLKPEWNIEDLGGSLAS